MTIEEFLDHAIYYGISIESKLYQNMKYYLCKYQEKEFYLVIKNKNRMKKYSCTGFSENMKDYYYNIQYLSNKKLFVLFRDNFEEEEWYGNFLEELDNFVYRDHWMFKNSDESHIMYRYPEAFIKVDSLLDVFDKINIPIKFEIGKYYEHTTGNKIYICGELVTYMWGKCLVAESNKTELVVVGKYENSSVNYKEIPKEEYMKYYIKV